MTDYKRLTKYKGEPLHTDMEVTDGDEIYERLAELEDLIENGTLIGLPCVRKINSGLGKYEAVYFKEHFDTVQECVVNSIEQGWEMIAYYGNAHCKAEAEARLAELTGGGK